MIDVSQLVTEGGSVLIEYDAGTADVFDAGDVVGAPAEPGFIASARSAEGTEVGRGKGPTPQHALANVVELAGPGALLELPL